MYAKCARQLCNDLSTYHSSPIPKADLEQKFKVDLQAFEPDDTVFLESDEFFFEPISRQELRTYTLNQSDIDNHRLLEFKDCDPQAEPRAPCGYLGDNAYMRALMVYKYLDDEIFHGPRNNLDDDCDVLADIAKCDSKTWV